MLNQVIKVKRDTIAACITCPLCHKLLRDATTITECLHTCCRKCINKKLSDEECCPICHIDLGCVPLEKLRRDHNLQDVRDKIFSYKRQDTPIKKKFKAHAQRSKNQEEKVMETETVKNEMEKAVVDEKVVDDQPNMKDNVSVEKNQALLEGQSVANQIEVDAVAFGRQNVEQPALFDQTQAFVVDHIQGISDTLDGVLNVIGDVPIIRSQVADLVAYQSVFQTSMKDFLNDVKKGEEDRKQELQLQTSMKDFLNDVKKADEDRKQDLQRMIEENLKLQKKAIEIKKEHLQVQKESLDSKQRLLTLAKEMKEFHEKALAAEVKGLEEIKRAKEESVNNFYYNTLTLEELTRFRYLVNSSTCYQQAVKSVVLKTFLEDTGQAKKILDVIKYRIEYDRETGDSSTFEMIEDDLKTVFRCSGFSVDISNSVATDFWNWLYKGHPGLTRPISSKEQKALSQVDLGCVPLEKLRPFAELSGSHIFHMTGKRTERIQKPSDKDSGEPSAAKKRSRNELAGLQAKKKKKSEIYPFESARVDACSGSESPIPAGNSTKRMGCPWDVIPVPMVNTEDVSTTHKPGKFCPEWDLDINAQCVDPDVARLWCQEAPLPRDVVMAQQLTTYDLVRLSCGHRAQLHVYENELAVRALSDVDDLSKKLTMAEQKIMALDGSRVLLEQQHDNDVKTIQSLNAEISGHISDLVKVIKENKQLKSDAAEYAKVKGELESRAQKAESELEETKRTLATLQSAHKDLVARQIQMLKTETDKAVALNKSSSQFNQELDVILAPLLNAGYKMAVDGLQKSGLN